MEFPAECLNRLKDVWEFQIDQFLVLARPDIQALFIVSPSARFIWYLLKDGASFETLVREFTLAYDIPKTSAEHDVTRTLQDWFSGLLAHQVCPVSVLPSECSDSLRSNFFECNYLVHGRSVGVVLGTSELADEIGPRLAWLPHSPSAPEFTLRVVRGSDAFHIFCGERCVASEPEITAIRGVLLQEIVRRCRAKDCLAILHAGACGSNQRCVVFPAGTQSGKTTLAAVLMKIGLTFYSDDSVLLERGTLSIPVMPFSLMVREGSWDVLYSRFPNLKSARTFSRLGQEVRFLPPTLKKQDVHCEHIAGIVFVRFDRHAANEIAAVSPVEALLRFQESGFWVAHDENSIRAFLSWVQSTASFVLNYSDVDAAASVIRGVIG